MECDGTCEHLNMTRHPIDGGHDLVQPSNLKFDTNSVETRKT